VWKDWGSTEEEERRVERENPNMSVVLENAL
jgi:hypothetical protein